MYVIGTAGHVDHGKSTLVRSLTGIDPDRLPEERAREMTIDLGFAWLKLPSGREVSIVDVPGHERFIKNMLAGVGGIDLALLVIAADEGVMPQTREHLAILDLLQVRNGVVAITKKELVDEEWLEMVMGEVEEILRPTSLAGAPLVAVSSVTGEGLPALVDTLDTVLGRTLPRRETGKPRLPIDRVFTVVGFGTVVTGTLLDGRLTLGQEIEIVPRGIRSRVRGLQTHKRKVDQALPGTRVAVNLSGVATTDMERGDVLTTPGWLIPTAVVDTRLRLTRDAPKPLVHNTQVSLHTGSCEAIGRVRLLDTLELAPGGEGWGQIKLDRPLAVAKGDFFIIRSPQTTLGGGQVVEPHPKRHKRFHAPTLRTLAILDQGGPEELLLQKLAEKEPSSIGALMERSGLPPGEGKKAVQGLMEKGDLVSLGERDAYLMTRGGWEELRREIRRVMEGYHAQFPLRGGMPKEEIKSRLRLDARFFATVVQHLCGEGEILEARGLLRLPDHQAILTPAQRAAVDAFLHNLAAHPYSPPTDNMPDVDLVSFLIDRGKVVKVGEVLFASGAYEEMVDRIKAHLKTSGKITVAEVRDMFDSSRKYALSILEHLDEQKVTRRVGDERVLC